MRRPPSMPALSLLCLLALGLSSCELTEVTVAEGESRIIVQSVIAIDRLSQSVIVERSLTGNLQDTLTELPGGGGVAIDGAEVTIANDGPSLCSSAPPTIFSQSRPGEAYGAILHCRPSPGDHLRLRVVTPAGAVVTGSTTVPGARSVSVRLTTDSATTTGQVLDLDRERDTLRIGVGPILARAMQVEIRQRDDLDEEAIYLFTDTLGIAFPGNLINPFEGDDGKPVFEVGKQYSLTVAVTDTNYYDFVRSRSDPFTGRGFINHLEGGIGVFGSVETYTYYLRVVR